MQSKVEMKNGSRDLKEMSDIDSENSVYSGADIDEFFGVADTLSEPVFGSQHSSSSDSSSSPASSSPLGGSPDSKSPADASLPSRPSNGSSIDASAVITKMLDFFPVAFAGSKYLGTDHTGHKSFATTTYKNPKINFDRQTHIVLENTDGFKLLVQSLAYIFSDKTLNKDKVLGKTVNQFKPGNKMPEKVNLVEWLEKQAAIVKGKTLIAESQANKPKVLKCFQTFLEVARPHITKKSLKDLGWDLKNNNVQTLTSMFGNKRKANCLQSGTVASTLQRTPSANGRSDSAAPLPEERKHNAMAERSQSAPAAASASDNPFTQTQVLGAAPSRSQAEPSKVKPPLKKKQRTLPQDGLKPKQTNPFAASLSVGRLANQSSIDVPPLAASSSAQKKPLVRHPLTDASSQLNAGSSPVPFRPATQTPQFGSTGTATKTMATSFARASDIVKSPGLGLLNFR